MLKIQSFNIKFKILSVFLLFFYISYACHNTQFYNITAVDNGDGTTTYNIDLEIDVGSSDGYSYGFVLEFYSSNNAVIAESMSPMTLSRPGYDDLQGYIGNAIGSQGIQVFGVPIFNQFSAQNAISFEATDDSYGFGSTDYDVSISVTVRGCVEQILLTADLRSKTNGLAEQCIKTWDIGECNIPLCPANNASLSSCDLFDLTALETTITGSTDYDLLWSVNNPEAYEGFDGEQVTVTVSGDDCQSAEAIITLEQETPPVVFNGLYVVCGVDRADFDLESTQADIAPFDYQSADFTWYADAAKQILINNITSYNSPPATVYVDVDLGGCISAASLQLQLTELDVNNSVSINECSNQSSYDFDLTSLQTEITNGNDYLIEWYADAQGNNPINNPASYNSSGGIVYAIITSDNSDCESIVEVPISVGEVVANDYTIEICENGTQTTLNLNDYEANINSNLGYSIQWYENENLTGRINFPSVYSTTGGIIYAQVVEDGGTCSGLAQVTIELNTGPTVFNGVYVQCEDGSGKATFDLNSVKADIAPFDYTIATYTWYLDEELSSRIYNIDNYESETKTIYVVVDNGVCSSVASLQLQANSLSVEDLLYTACDEGGNTANLNLDEIANTQLPAGSTVNWYQNNNLTNAITQTANYSTGPGTIFAEIISSNCTTSTSLTITLDGVVANNVDITECNRGDGTAVFDLTTLNTSINGGTSNIVTFWQDANATLTQITNPTEYSSAETTIYAKVSSGEECYEIAAINLLIQGDIEANDLDIQLTSTTNSLASILLSDYEDAISIGNTISFFRDIDLVNEINANVAFNTASDTIYALIETDDGCSAIARLYITVEAGPNGPQIKSSTVYSCKDGETATFDLTTILPEILNGIDGEIEWYIDAVAQNQITNPNAFVSQEGVVYANLVGTEQIVEVLLRFSDFKIGSSSMQMCDDGSGSATFNLNLLNDELTAGTGFSVVWFEDEDLDSEIENPQGYMSGQTTVYALIDEGNCREIFEVSLTVGPLLAVNTSMSLCQEANGKAIFDLTSINEEVSGNSYYTIDWYWDANGDTSINRPDFIESAGGQRVYAQVVANSSCKSELAAVDLIIENIVGQPTSIVNCDGGDLSQYFDLTTAEKTVNNGTNNQVEWFSDVNLRNKILDVYQYVPEDNVNGISLIYAQVCEDVVDVSLKIRLEDSLSVKIDYDTSVLERGENITLQTDQGDLDHFWSPGSFFDDSTQSSPILMSDSSQIYSVRVVDEFGCEASDTIFVRVVDKKQDIIVASQIFSPGLDGQNDQLKFTIEGTCDLEVSIYDRWGVEVFSATSTNQTWDGTFNESPLPSGTYVYYVYAQFCGNSKAYNYKGEIYLVR